MSPTARDVDLAKADASRLERERLLDYVISEIRDESVAKDDKDKVFLQGWNAAMAAVRARLA